MLFKSITAGDKVSEMLDQHTQENEKQFEPCTSSAFDREARRLINRMKMPEGLCAVLSIPNTRILVWVICYNHAYLAFQPIVWGILCYAYYSLQSCQA